MESPGKNDGETYAQTPYKIADKRVKLDERAEKSLWRTPKRSFVSIEAMKSNKEHMDVLLRFFEKHSGFENYSGQAQNSYYDDIE